MKVLPNKMPLIQVKNYTWRQTNEMILINVPVSRNPKKVNLFAVDNYVKINYSPFILELFLWGGIRESESTCTLSEEQLILTLEKNEKNVEWPCLELDNLDKSSKREYRERASQKAHKLAQDNLKTKSDKRHELQQKAVRAQIDLNNVTLNKIDTIRDSHRKEAMCEFEEWNSKCGLPILNHHQGQVQENRKSYRRPLEILENSVSVEEIVIPKTKPSPGQDYINKLFDKQVISKSNTIFDDPYQSLPRPRKTATIHIQFSERVFPTPARESHHVEEQEWLAKQAEARRKTGFVLEDLKPEEQDPQWLLDKGNDFFAAGNYLAAISAYSYGIKLSDKMASLYANRSASHYALENYHRCLEDCSTALKLMKPECQSNLESRAKCYARRGVALCKLSSPQHGIPELEYALKLIPNDESIKKDLLAAKQYFQIDQ